MNLITSHTRRHPNDEGIQRASASSLWNLTAGNNDNKQASGQVAASTMAAALRRHVRVAPVVEPVLGEGASSQGCFSTPSGTHPRVPSGTHPRMCASMRKYTSPSFSITGTLSYAHVCEAGSNDWKKDGIILDFLYSTRINKHSPWGNQSFALNFLFCFSFVKNFDVFHSH